MLEIDQARNGDCLEVSLGEAIQVKLPENPTTGYRWRLQSAGEEALDLEEDSSERSPGGLGAGGARSWHFQARQAGLVRLEFALQRSWQPQPIETFRVTITVKAR
jgi:inhibitor of cysteine peptidase